MKKQLLLLAAAIVVLLSVSCAASRWSTVDLNDKAYVEKVMSELFPELHERYNRGEIVVNKIKYRPQEDGSIKWNLYYTDSSDGDDTELLEWMLIHTPVLHN